MSPRPPVPAPQPSWTRPILAGAGVTVLLHGAVLWDHALWLPVLSSCGCSAAPIGLLPAILALRRDPQMGPAAGFAVAFIAVGIGALLLTVVTLLQGFTITPETEAALRESLRAAKYETDEIERFLGALHDSGGTTPVLAATLLALGGGVSGAAVAGLAIRRRRRGPPAVPPVVPPPAP